ncbi:MAG TPA: hypothetical protein VHT49_10960 [Acidimicrobiales bacterium]|nr:hypothetical protein [Acidimicrobiales bacterium]
MLGALAFPVMDGFASTAAGAAGITATAGGAIGQTTLAAGATWGSIPTTLTTGTPPAGALVQTFTTSLLGSPGPQTFFSYNSGNVDLAATTYTVTLAQSGLIVGTPTATLKTCTVTWTATCSGTSTTINTWTGGAGTPTATTVVPVTPGSRLSIQTSIGGVGLSLGGTITVTISTGVNSLTPRQIRAAVTTNA